MGDLPGTTVGRVTSRVVPQAPLRASLQCSSTARQLYCHELIGTQQLVISLSFRVLPLVLSHGIATPFGAGRSLRE